MSVVLGFGQRGIGVAVWGYCESAVVQCFVRNDLFVKESMGGKDSWRALCYNLVILFLYLNDGLRRDKALAVFSF